MLTAPVKLTSTRAAAAAASSASSRGVAELAEGDDGDVEVAVRRDEAIDEPRMLGDCGGVERHDVDRDASGAQLADFDVVRASGSQHNRRGRRRHQRVDDRSADVAGATKQHDRLCPAQGVVHHALPTVSVRWRRRL